MGTWQMGMETGRRAFARALVAGLAWAGLTGPDCRAEGRKDGASDTGRTEPKALKVPKAEVVLQETWAYNPAHPDYGRVPHMGASPSDMYARLHANYGELARRHGLRVIPVGTAVEEFRRLRVRNPRMDAAMTPPDGKHLTNRGRYLQALVWLGALFPDVDLRSLDYDGDMEPEVIEAARTAACHALDQAKPRR